MLVGATSVRILPQVALAVAQIYMLTAKKCVRRVQNHRPDYFGFVKCSLAWAAVKEKYDSGAVEDKFESTKVRSSSPVTMQPELKNARLLHVQWGL